MSASKVAELLNHVKVTDLAASERFPWITHFIIRWYGPNMFSDFWRRPYQQKFNSRLENLRNNNNFQVSKSRLHLVRKPRVYANTESSLFPERHRLALSTSTRSISDRNWSNNSQWLCKCNAPVNGTLTSNRPLRALVWFVYSPCDAGCHYGLYER